MKYIPKKERAKIIKQFKDVIRILKRCKTPYLYICHYLRDEASIIFLEEKPTSTKHSEFFKYRYYTGGHAWWKFGSLNPNPHLEIYAQKVAFLEKLVKIIENQK